MPARSIANKIQIGSHVVVVYASPRVGQALHDLTQDMNLYEGVKLISILEAVYEQGKKDGARSAFEALASKVLEAEAQVPHRNPGKPKKRK